MNELLQAPAVTEAQVSDLSGLSLPHRGILQARFEAARLEMRSEQFLSQAFAGPFSAKSVPAGGEPFIHGFDRPGDDSIVQQVINQLVQVDGERPLRILEVGAGRTYGIEPHHGAPWLSRAFKRAFGGMVDVTVSDPDARDLQAFTFDTNRTLQSLCLRQFIGAAGKMMSQPLSRPDEELRFSGISIMSLFRNNLGFAEELNQKITLLGHYERFIASPEKARVLFLRPAIDPLFEEKTFGIKFMGRVCAGSLGAHFPDGHFDVVFARHLHPSLKKHMQKILRSADQVMNSSGVAIMHGDWPSDFKE